MSHYQHKRSNKSTIKLCVKEKPMAEYLKVVFPEYNTYNWLLLFSTSRHFAVFFFSPSASSFFPNFLLPVWRMRGGNPLHTWCKTVFRIVFYTCSRQYHRFKPKMPLKSRKAMVSMVKSIPMSSVDVGDTLFLPKRHLSPLIVLYRLSHTVLLLQQVNLKPRLKL